MGLLQVISRIGAASAPWVAQFLRHADEKLPFILMGALTLIAALLCFKLDETKGKETAEVFENLKAIQGKISSHSSLLNLCKILCLLILRSFLAPHSFFVIFIFSRCDDLQQIFFQFSTLLPPPLFHFLRRIVLLLSRGITYEKFVNPTV